MSEVAIVVDLGFGDAGKGLVTDWRVRRMGARTVVRFNGGAQAGHNVVTPDGRHHTFSQLGAGAFVSGVRTFLARDVVVDPLALAVEARVLSEKTGGDPLSLVAIDAEARVITPFHRAMNRIRERLRGAGAHGSCGVGFGETVQDALAFPDETLRFGELLGDAGLRERLARVRERKRAECAAAIAEFEGGGGSTGASGGSVSACGEPASAEEKASARVSALPLAGQIDPSTPRALEAELAVFEDPALLDRWLELVQAVSRKVRVGDLALLAEWLREAPAVFEGAQGVLLDERHGFAPHTTWSDCTFAGAEALLRDTAVPVSRTRYGVLRTHVVRHGAGPLPTETPELQGRIQEHNRAHPFQGHVRYGWFDAVLGRYALGVVGGVDQLVLTHGDLLASAGLRACDAYRVRGECASALPPLEGEALTGWLREARALSSPLPSDPGAAVGKLEGLLGRRVDVLSRGPTAEHLDSWEGAASR